MDAVSLFTGCGGSDRGLIDAGWRIVMANDILPYAKEVYEANLPETDFRTTSIKEIESFPSADLLIGCYPCQGFSQGGARDSERSVNKLYLEFDRALREIQPKAFVVENVAGMARSNNRHILEDQLLRFRSAGFVVPDPLIINSTEYGLAQERRRIFIVGIRNDIGVEYQFPQPTHGPGLNPVNTQREALRGLTETWPEGDFCDQAFHWYYLSRNRYRGWDEPSRTILASDRHMPLHPMSPEMTKVEKDKWIFKGDPSLARRLSFKEAAALQDLADWDFPDTVPLTTKYKVIGNAVPPMVFRQVVDAIPQGVFV